ncbi:MAG TPA: hypothetical protein VM487_02870 [Phycisphaerae bacterium]|nr:hypothetical protein [Phycisphaerae bacterium]
MAAELNGARRVGAESGRWYSLLDAPAGRSAAFQESVEKAGRLLVGRKPYDCAACGKVIAAGTEHWAGSSERVHANCPRPTTEPTVKHALALGLYPSVSSINNLRVKAELHAHRELEIAERAVLLGANPPAGADPRVDAHSLAMLARDAYANEITAMGDAGTEAHAAIARFYERGEVAEDWRELIIEHDRWESETLGREPGHRGWCEVPVALPALGYAGTIDRVVPLANGRGAALIDHKSKDFGKNEAYFARVNTERTEKGLAPVPFHFRPWTTEGMQIAAYHRTLVSPGAVVGQADRHAELRTLLATRPAVYCFQHYFGRGTQRRWVLDWQETRFDKGVESHPYHDGLPRYLRLFDSYRRTWFEENNYNPPGLEA